MEYSRIFSRAWAITWRWKVLWVLGFLVSLGRGNMTSSNNMTYSFGSESMPSWLADLGSIDWRMLGAVILGLACLGLLLMVILWVLSVIARGGLIAGVNQVEEEGSTTLGRAWAVGQRRFWTIFGIGVLAVLPFIIITLIVVAIVIAAVLVTVLGGEDFWSALEPLWIGLALCLIPLGCVAWIGALVLRLVRIYAERAAIIEDLGWIDAFKRGWEFLKAHVGPTIVVGIVVLVVWILFVVVVAVGMALIAVPFIALFGNSDSGSWLVLLLCGAGLFALLAGALVGSVLEVFTSASWTLLYRDLTGRGAAAVPAPVTAPPVEAA